MAEFPLSKINSFREKNLFRMDNDRKKAFLSLDKNSLFLKKVIESKEKERKTSTKIFETEIGMNKNIKNSEKLLYKKVQNYYQSPINIPKQENISIKKIKNKRYEHELENYIKNVNISEIKSPKNQINKNNDKINTYYHKMPINILKEYSLSPRVFQYKSSTYDNKETENEGEQKVINYKGKKIFSTSSFKGLSDRTNYNSSKNIAENSSELFRNYTQLKQKKEEIYRRKIKKNNSAQNKHMLEIQKDKEIKQEHINLKNELFKNNSIDSKKLRKIPVDRKNLKFHMNKSNTEKTNKSNDISKEINSKNIIKNNSTELNNLLKESKIMINTNNYLYSTKDKTSYNTNRNKNNIIKKVNNIIFHDENYDYSNYNKDKSNTINNIINNMEIKVHSNKIREKYEKSKTFDLNPKYKEKKYNLDKYIDINKYTTLKKHFVEDNLNNSIYCSKDKKLMIKIHSIQNINQIFLVKRRKKQNLKIEKIINVFLTNNIRSYFNFLTYNDLLKKSNRLKRIKLLSAIKEEEEKSKNDLTKSGSQIEDQEKMKNKMKINQSKIIGELKKVFFLPEKDNIHEDIKNNIEEKIN